MRPLLDILYNFHWVREGEAARASQAHIGGLKRLMKRHGLKSIVNLRGENRDLSWWRYEKRVCESLGATHLDAMMDSRHLPTRPMLVRLMQTFEEAPRPLLLKCSGGNDRTGLAAALYLVHRGGWGARMAALAQFSGVAKQQQRWAKAFLSYAEEDARGRPLGEWIAIAYEPERFAEWLRAHGLAESFAGIFKTPTRSPWQL